MPSTEDPAQHRSTSNGNGKGRSKAGYALDSQVVADLGGTRILGEIRIDLGSRSADGGAGW